MQPDIKAYRLSLACCRAQLCFQQSQLSLEAVKTRQIESLLFLGLDFLKWMQKGNLSVLMAERVLSYTRRFLACLGSS